MCENCKKYNVLLDHDDTRPKHDAEKSFKNAVKIVMSQGLASCAFLVSSLQIGYQRAWTFIKRMENLGYIESSSDKVKKVLITSDQFDKDFGEEHKF